MNLLNDICNPLWITKNVIYCYTNKINNKKYVGQTIQTLKSRHSNHMYDSFNEKRIKNYNNPFHNAIRNCLKGRTKTSYGFIWKYYE